jgi:hypothetical protein
MKRTQLLEALILAAISLPCLSQAKHTAVPIGEALSKAFPKGSLTGDGARPFHIRVEISEPENPQSAYQGSLEEWWVSSDQWRREVKDKDGLRQTIVVAGGKKTEKDEGDYLPIWLRNFVRAAFDPIPNASQWVSSGAMVEQTFFPGAKTDACARIQSKIGSPDRATTVYSNVCFDEDGTLKFVGSPGYSMEFHDYRGFGNKKIARTLSDDPESGTKLVGRVTILEDEAKVKGDSDLFTPLPADEDRFREIQVSAETMEKLIADNPPIVWPTVHSGNIRGRDAIYLSIDTQGRVREAWPLNSDNGGVDDSVRDQARKWKMKPAIDKTGKQVQVDGSLSFAFETRVEDPLPELSDTEVRQLAIKIDEPVWPTNFVRPGQVIEISVAVDEQGQVAGVSYTKVPPSGAAPVLMAASDALHHSTFRPLVRNGRPQYFHGTLRFIVR